VGDKNSQRRGCCPARPAMAIDGLALSSKRIPPGSIAPTVSVGGDPAHAGVLGWF
jgi:hypothetical protein